MIKTFPFKYDCPPPKPNNRKEYAASKTTCAGIDKNPFSKKESYLAQKTTYKNGQVFSDEKFELAEVANFNSNDRRY